MTTPYAMDEIEETDRDVLNRRARWCLYLIVGAFVSSGFLSDEFQVLAEWLAPYFPFLKQELVRNTERGVRTARFFAGAILLCPLVVALLLSGIWRDGRIARQGSFRQRFRGMHPIKFSLLILAGMAIYVLFVWMVWASPFPITNQKGDSFLRWMLGSDLGLLIVGTFIVFFTCMFIAMVVLSVFLPIDLILHWWRQHSRYRSR